MKRCGGLWDTVTSFESLYAAAYRTLRGKRAKVTAAGFFGDLEGNLIALQRELLAGTYRPGAYRTFWIEDPKPRLISAAPFRDRVVHHALVAAIEPVFERRFIHHSYACRVGKGTHRALDRFTTWIRSHRYVLKMDVRKFFPSIDHEILLSSLERRLKDRPVLELCRTIVESSNAQEDVVQYFEGDDLFTPFERRRGIPIGNLTSQFFANVYLDALDHFVVERARAPRYLRYVDDFCCFGDSKVELRALREEIVEYLATLRLRLNERKSRIRRVGEGVEFLGFVVTPTRSRLGATAVRRQRRRMRWMQGALARGELSTAEVARSMEAWCAHARHGTTGALTKRVRSVARSELRARGGTGTKP